MTIQDHSIPWDELQGAQDQMISAAQESAPAPSPGADSREFWDALEAKQSTHPKRFPKKSTFADGLGSTSTGQPRTFWNAVPFLRTIQEGRDLGELDAAVEAVHSGTADDYQRDLVELASIQRFASENATLGGKIGSGLAESGLFMAEFALTPGAGAGAQGAKAAATGGRAAQLAKGLGRGVVQGTKVAATQEAMMAPTGASNLRNNVVERTMRGFGYAEQAGEMSLVLDEVKPALMDVLPESIISTLMEPISEKSGQGLAALGIDKLDGAIFALFRRWGARNPGGTASAFGKALRQRMSMGGFAEEVAEEFYSGAVQEGLAAAAPEDLEGLKGSLMTEADDILAMMATVAVAQGGIGAVSMVPDAATPSVQEGASEAIDATPEKAPGKVKGITQKRGDNKGTPPTQGVPIPAPTEEAVQSVLQRAGESERVGSFEVAPPETLSKSEKVTEDLFGQLGMRAIHVDSEGSWTAQLPDQGVVLLNRRNLEDGEFPAGTLWHEALHSMRDRNEESYQGVLARIQELDPEGLAAAQQKYAEDFGVEDFAALSETRQVEEGVAFRTEELASYLEYLSLPEGAKNIQTLLRQDRSLLQKVVDMVRDVIARIGGSSLDAKRLEAISERLGLEASTLDAGLAQEIHSVITEQAGRVEGLAPRPQAGSVGRPEQGPLVTRKERAAVRKAKKLGDVEAMEAQIEELREKLSERVRTPASVLAEHGGLNLSLGDTAQSQDVWGRMEGLAAGDRGVGSRNWIKGPKTKSKRGLSLDKARALLAEVGFHADETETGLHTVSIDQLIDMVEAEISGSPMIHPESAGDVASAEALIADLEAEIHHTQEDAERDVDESPAEIVGEAEQEDSGSTPDALLDEPPFSPPKSGESAKSGETEGRFSPKGAKSKGFSRFDLIENFALPPETWWDKTLTGIADKQRRLEVLMETFDGLGVEPGADVETASRLWRGLAQHKRDDFERRFREPIKELIRKRKLKVEEIDLFLMALHRDEAIAHLQAKADAIAAKESDYAAVKEAHAQMRRDLAKEHGMTQLQLRGIKEGHKLFKELRAIEVAEKKKLDAARKKAPVVVDIGMDEAQRDEALKLASKPGMQEVADLVQEMNDATLQLKLDYGLIDQATYDLWDNQFQRYIPLKTDHVDGDSFGSYSKGYDTRGPETHARKGRSKMADSPLTFSLVAAHNAILRGEKNRVGQAFYELVKEHGSIGTVEVTPEDKLNEDPKKYADEEFRTKVDGVSHSILIRDEALAKSMKNMGVSEMHPIIKGVRKFQRFIGSMLTQYNPVFWPTNLARDLGAAFVNVAEVDADGIGRSVLANMPSMVAQSWRWSRHGADSTGDVTWAERASAAGMRTGWSHVVDFKEEAADFGKHLEGGNMRAFFEGAKDFVDNTNNAFEQATRVSVFKTLVEKAGMTDAQAAKYARGVSVDFNRAGTQTQWLNALYLFFNASVQGNLRAGKALLTNPRVFRRRTIPLVVFAATMDAAMRAFSPEDDDGRKVYDNIPEYVKENNAIFMWPDGSGRYSKVPLPYGYNVIHNLGRLVSSIGAGKSDPGESALKLSIAAWNSFSPIQGGTPLQTVTPTIARPYVEIGENLNFAGFPIAPDRMPGDLTPDSHNTKSNTPERLTWIAQQLNEWTGGDATHPGGIDVNPESLDHLWEAYTGGIGKIISRSGKAIGNWTSGVPVETNDIPLYRRFVGEPTHHGVSTTYYDLRNEIKRAEDLIDYHKEQGARQRATRYRRDNRDLLALKSRMESSEKRLRDLRKKRKATEDKQELKKLEDQMHSIRARFVRVADQRLKDHP